MKSIVNSLNKVSNLLVGILMFMKLHMYFLHYKLFIMGTINFAPKVQKGNSTALYI